jgi:ATP-dependent helicase STH1/SNF2
VSLGARQVFEQLKKRREQRDRDQMNVRAKLIRDNNLKEWVEEVKKSKNKRIMDLLKETDNFLRQLGAKVMVQKGEDGGPEDDG